MAPPPPPSDAELDVQIRARLATLGIDLSVLPVDDRRAPADQTRVLASVRALLRATVPTVSGWSTDLQRYPPALYPAPFSHWTRRAGG